MIEGTTTEDLFKEAEEAAKAEEARIAAKVEADLGAFKASATTAITDGSEPTLVAAVEVALRMSQRVVDALGYTLQYTLTKNA